MIITTHILLLPVVLLIWVMDAFLLLMLFRQFCYLSKTLQDSKAHLAVQELTNPVTSKFEQWLTKLRGNHAPRSAAWLILTLTLLVARYILIALIQIGSTTPS